jgi:hypothetical protein
MYAVVAFMSPEAIFSKVSSDAEIVASESPPPSVTETLPSWTSTFHVPAPSISKTYELVIPAVLEGSIRPSRLSKNSRAVMLSSLGRRSAASLHHRLRRQAARPARRR